MVHVGWIQQQKFTVICLNKADNGKWIYKEFKDVLLDACTINLDNPDNYNSYYGNDSEHVLKFVLDRSYMVQGLNLRLYRNVL